MDFHEDLQDLDPGLGGCWTTPLLELKEGWSLLRTQKSPEWELGQGSALLDLDMDEGQKVVQDGPN